MLTQHRYSIVFSLGTAMLGGCSTGHGAPSTSDVGGESSQEGVRDRAEAGAAGMAEMMEGPGGAAGAASEDVCSAATDCDDGLSCNGREVCVAGECQAGVATPCDVGMECSEGESGKCVFTDHSPWIVYEADDDTPGVPEVYAVKRGLLGKVQPIKINAPLETGWAALRPGTWSADHQMYAFTVVRREPYEVAVQVVHFGSGLPEPAVQLPGDEGQWSPSGKLLAIAGPIGVTIYTRNEAGTVELAFRESDVDREQVSGWWGENDSFVFAAQRTSDNLWDISRAYLDGVTWRTGLVVEDLELQSFTLSRNLSEIVYATRDKSQSDQYLFAHSLQRINFPISIAGPGSSGIGWSPDGQNYLLWIKPSSNDESPHERQVFLGTGDVADLKLRQIAQGLDLLAASFTPDGKRFLTRRQDPEWGERLAVYDIATGAGTSLGDLIAHTDDVRWSPDGGRLAIPNHTSETSDVELKLVGVAANRATLRLDLIAANQRYYNLQFSRGGEFFAYYKGDGANRDYDAAYVDLRYHTVVDPKPVRLPGEGKMWTMNFDPDGSALYYIRERSNGARDCFFLDLSQQVAKEAVQINRAGRVDHCYAQPLSE